MLLTLLHCGRKSWTWTFYQPTSQFSISLLGQLVKLPMMLPTSKVLELCPSTALTEWYFHFSGPWDLWILWGILFPFGLVPLGQLLFLGPHYLVDEDIMA